MFLVSVTESITIVTFKASKYASIIKGNANGVTSHIVWNNDLRTASIKACGETTRYLSQVRINSTSSLPFTFTEWNSTSKCLQAIIDKIDPSIVADNSSFIYLVDDRGIVHARTTADAVEEIEPSTEPTIVLPLPSVPDLLGVGDFKTLQVSSTSTTIQVLNKTEITGFYIGSTDYPFLSTQATNNTFTAPLNNTGTSPTRVCVGTYNTLYTNTARSQTQTCILIPAVIDYSRAVAVDYNYSGVSFNFSIPDPIISSRFNVWFYLDVNNNGTIATKSINVTAVNSTMGLYSNAFLFSSDSTSLGNFSYQFQSVWADNPLLVLARVLMVEWL